MAGDFVVVIFRQIWVRHHIVMGIVIRQSFKGAVLTYIGAGIGFVTQFYVVTKFLDPEVLGLTKVFVEIANLCMGFALLGTTSSGMRFFPYFKNEHNGNNGFFFYYLLVPLIGTVLLSIVYLCCKQPILDFFASSSHLFEQFFFLVVPLIFILTFWTVFENYSNINMRIAVPKGVREICLRIFLLVDYLLYAFGYTDLSGLIISLIVAYALCLFIDIVYVSRTADVSLKHDYSFITPDFRSKYLKYTGFLLLAAISGNIMSQLDIFMLSSVKGMYSAGVYTIALYMANIIDMPSRSITSISSPIASMALNNGHFEEAKILYQKVSIHQFLSSGFILLLIWINIDNIFEIIPNGETYREGTYVVLFLGLSKVISSTLSFGSVLIQFSRYYYWGLYISIFLTFLTICTNLYFIPRMGISGAALATLISTVISYSFQQFLVQNQNSVHQLQK